MGNLYQSTWGIRVKRERHFLDGAGQSAQWKCGNRTSDKIGMPNEHLRVPGSSALGSLGLANLHGQS